MKYISSVYSRAKIVVVYPITRIKSNSLFNLKTIPLEKCVPISEVKLVWQLFKIQIPSAEFSYEGKWSESFTNIWEKQWIYFVNLWEKIKLNSKTTKT